MQKRIRVRKYVAHYTFQHMSTIIKLSQDVTQYYITDRRDCENTKRRTIMNSTKDAHELQKENSGYEQGGLAGGGIHAFSAHI